MAKASPALAALLFALSSSGGEATSLVRVRGLNDEADSLPPGPAALVEIQERSRRSTAHARANPKLCDEFQWGKHTKLHPSRARWKGETNALRLAELTCRSGPHPSVCLEAHCVGQLAASKDLSEQQKEQITEYNSRAQLRCLSKRSSAKFDVDYCLPEDTIGKAKAFKNRVHCAVAKWACAKSDKERQKQSIAGVSAMKETCIFEARNNWEKESACLRDFQQYGQAFDELANKRYPDEPAKASMENLAEALVNQSEAYIKAEAHHCDAVEPAAAEGRRTQAVVCALEGFEGKLLAGQTSAQAYGPDRSKLMIALKDYCSDHIPASASGIICSEDAVIRFGQLRFRPKQTFDQLTPAWSLFKELAEDVEERIAGFSDYFLESARAKAKQKVDPDHDHPDVLAALRISCDALVQVRQTCAGKAQQAEDARGEDDAKEQAQTDLWMAACRFAFKTLKRELSEGSIARAKKKLKDERESLLKEKERLTVELEQVEAHRKNDRVKKEEELEAVEEALESASVDEIRWKVQRELPLEAKLGDFLRQKTKAFEVDLKKMAGDDPFRDAYVRELEGYRKLYREVLKRQEEAVERKLVEAEEAASSGLVSGLVKTENIEEVKRLKKDKWRLWALKTQPPKVNLVQWIADSWGNFSARRTEYLKRGPANEVMANELGSRMAALQELLDDSAVTLYREFDEAHTEEARRVSISKLIMALQPGIVAMLKERDYTGVAGVYMSEMQKIDSKDSWAQCVGNRSEDTCANLCTWFSKQSTSYAERVLGKLQGELKEGKSVPQFQLCEAWTLYRACPEEAVCTGTSPFSDKVSRQKARATCLVNNPPSNMLQVKDACTRWLDEFGRAKTSFGRSSSIEDLMNAGRRHTEVQCELLQETFCYLMQDHCKWLGQRRCSFEKRAPDCCVEAPAYLEDCDKDESHPHVSYIMVTNAEDCEDYASMVEGVRYCGEEDYSTTTPRGCYNDGRGCVRYNGADRTWRSWDFADRWGREHNADEIFKDYKEICIKYKPPKALAASFVQHGDAQAFHGAWQESPRALLRHEASGPAAARAASRPGRWDGRAQPKPRLAP